MSINTHMVPHVSTNICKNVVCWFPFTPKRLMCVWTDKEKFRIWMLYNFFLVSSAFITYVSLDILYLKTSYPIPAIFRKFNIPFLGKVSKKDEEQ